MKNATQGFSILEVLVSSILIAIGIIALHKPFGNLLLAITERKVATSFTDVIAPLQTTVIDTVIAYDKEYKCRKPDMFGTILQQKFLDSFSSMVFADKQVPISVAADSPKGFKEAADRCSKPNLGGSTASEMYFCAHILGTALVENGESKLMSLGKHAFLHSAMPFVEVWVKFKQSSTDKPIPCQDLAWYTDAAIEVHHRVYWSFAVEQSQEKKKFKILSAKYTGAP